MHLDGITLVELMGVEIGFPRTIAAEPLGDNDMPVGRLGGWRSRDGGCQSAGWSRRGGVCKG